VIFPVRPPPTVFIWIWTILTQWFLRRFLLYTLYWSPSLPRGPLLYKIILHYIKNFLADLTFSGAMVLEKIFTDFSNINTSKNSFFYSGSTGPLGTMIFTNLILRYVRKFPCKFQLLSPSGFCYENFYNNYIFFIYKHT
jgi:hypothetical protein